MNEGKFLLFTKNHVTPERLEEIRKKFMEELAEGVAVVPMGFEALYIPPDAERRG